MKILRVAGRIYPDSVGGVQLHVHDMSKIQTEIGHDVTVFVQKIGNEPNFEKRDGFKIRRFEPNVEIFGNPITLNMLNDLHHDFEDYDIVHAHSHLFFPTNLSSFLRKINDTPLVITNHGLESQTPPLWVSELYNRTLGKWTFNSADAIISYTEDEKQKMRKLGIKPEIEVIHNGINTERFKPMDNVEKKEQILWVGRFLPGKGVRYLIEAFHHLKKNHEDLKLKMVGDGPLKEKMVDKAKELGIYDDIIFETFVPNEKMPEIYNESKLFALASLTEGVPRTVLEALSCGVPVVSTRLPQITDILDGCGSVIAQKNPKKLANEIIRLFENEEIIKEYEKQGRIKIKENYSWRDTVKKTIKAYSKVLD